MTLISDFETFSLEIRFTRIPRLAKPILSQNKEPGQPRGHGATFYSNGVGVGGSRYRDTERRDERDRISDSECKGLEQRQSACSLLAPRWTPRPFCNQEMLRHGVGVASPITPARGCSDICMIEGEGVCA